MIDLDILVILDRSGSMEARKADHEGGVRSFVNDQRTLAGEVRFTLAQFDTTDPCEIVYDRVPLDQVGAITLIPRGGTPLLDAIGKAVAHLRAHQAREEAAQTIVLIVTDGEENSSREWTKPLVKALLGEVDRAGGHTLFLGADIDAFADAAAVGVAQAHTLNVTNAPVAIAAMYAVTSDKIKRARTMTSAGASMMAVASSLAYTDEERAAINQVTPTTTSGAE